MVEELKYISNKIEISQADDLCKAGTNRLAFDTPPRRFSNSIDVRDLHAINIRSNISPSSGKGR
jgi:hypothetical protein